jgi:hypothetical protein
VGTAPPACAGTLLAALLVESLAATLSAPAAPTSRANAAIAAAHAWGKRQ